MISIIISSANNQQLTAVLDNIHQTIGVVYEVIAIDNANAKLGICEVYNIGIERAKYEILCFMHEDLKIYTDNWGRLVNELFSKHEKLGMIGVAGGRYKTLFPCSWYTGSEKSDRYRLVQHFKFRQEEPKLDLNNPNEETLSLVSTLDGVWFCIRREALADVRFDENLLNGFHGYDTDISLSIGRRWNLSVTFEVLIEHFSEGKYDYKWIENALLVHKKWNKFLPLKTGNDFSKDDCIQIEHKAFETLMYLMVDAGHSRNQLYYVLWKSNLYRVIGWRLYFKMYGFISSLKLGVK